MNNFGLPERTINELTQFFKSRPDIEKVVIFGSRAKGTFHNGSDVDFAVWSNDEHLYKLASDLYDLPTPYKFDVIDYINLTHEGMKNSIDTDGIIFYTRD
ncbi:MAG: nucleotidyltransferase domain-containing protein [Muribaculaceae bacterium]|nr:nucleotidyltransferase domain-containing protein [Muribaculaceae bacterium]